MAYGTRPYSIWAYGFGPYSTWRKVDLQIDYWLGVSSQAGTLTNPVTHLIEAALAGVSVVSSRLYLDAVVHIGPLTGVSGIYPNLREYWENEPPSECGDVWTPGVPCEPVWTITTGCDVAWAPQPAPPFLCPEMEAADG